MSEEPAIGDTHYILSTARKRGYEIGQWDAYEHDYILLSRGLCFEREEDAKKAAKALFEDLRDE